MTQLRCTVVALFVAVVCSSADAQTQTSPTLLKRLAEAVDGYPSRGPVYVVARADSTNSVAGVFTDPGTAEVAARRMGSTFTVYGPYVNPIFRPRPVACFHDGISNMIPPPFRPAAGALSKVPGYCVDTTRPPGAPVRVSLVYEYDNGARHMIPVTPGVDAIFLSASAIDKFVIPYYTRIIGADGAAKMRNEMLARP